MGTIKGTVGTQGSKRNYRGYLTQGGTLLLALAVGGVLGGYFWGGFNSPSNEPLRQSALATGTSRSNGEPEPLVTGPARLTFATENWEAAELTVAPVVSQHLTERVRLTGKVSLNEDRIAHIYPMVEGAVDHVAVGLGAVVEADQLLVVVHSREVGQAKLELYQARLVAEMSEAKDRLQQEIAANSRELLHALRMGSSIQEIEKTFRAKTMGDYRERLLSAYSDFLKSDADAQRLVGLAEKGAVSEKQMFAAETSRNADLATFQARIEQIEHELKTSLLLSQQAVKEAHTRIAVAETNLRILGCTNEEIANVSPQDQGETISHYTIRAPFSGTVISKDVALREQVRPDTQILSVADLSTVWITADIFEQNVPLLSSLTGKRVAVRNEAWPNKVFSAKVFYTGEIMEERTRTISLQAVADNSDHLLKPGMFVNIEIETLSPNPYLVIPESAVQEHQGKTFVFVQVSPAEFEQRPIMLARQENGVVAVAEGLAPNEIVVATGGFILKSQMLSDLLGEE